MSDQDYEKSDELQAEYLAYNGLNRPALVMGVPLMILLPILFVAMFSGFILSNIFGLVGLVPAGFCLLSIIVLRAMTEHDPNAISVAIFRGRGLLLKKGKAVIAIRGKK